MLRILECYNKLPRAYQADFTVGFVPGNIAQLRRGSGNNIVVGLSDGIAPIGIIDDVHNAGFEINTSICSGKITVWSVKGMVCETDIFDKDQEYLINDKLYVNEHGLLTSKKQDMLKCVAAVSRPYNVKFLAFKWLLEDELEFYFNS